MRQIESFFWGIIAALGALLIELIVFIIASVNTSSKNAIPFQELFLLPAFLIGAVLIEEIFKYLVISKRVELYSLEKSYIVNSLFVGLGFVSTEFWLLSSSGVALSNQIILELSIIHLGTSGIIGYIIATRNPKKISTFLFAIAIASIFHGGYNFLIQKREYLENYSIFLLLGILIAMNFFNLLGISRKLAQK